MFIFSKKFITIALFYLFITLVITSTSFFVRKYDVKFATGIQVAVWTEYADKEALEAETTGYSVIKANLTRIMYPALMEGLSKVPGISLERAFSLLRIFSVFLFFLLFHFYLQEWVDEKSAFIGTLFVAGTISLTYNNWFEIPTEFPEMIFYTLGVWAIYKEKFWSLVLITFFATLNKETSVFLPLIYLFNLIDIGKIKADPKTLFKDLFSVFIVGLAWLVPYISLRFISGLGLEWNHANSLAHNIPGLMAFFDNLNPFNNFLFYIYLFGIFWIIPFLHWNNLSVFWKRTLLTVPIILCVFLFGGGFLNEAREIVLLYVILVPPSIAYLFNEKI